MHVVLETRWFVPNVLSLEFVRCISDWVFGLGYGISCRVQFFWINCQGVCGYVCIMNYHGHRKLTIFIPLTNLPCFCMPSWRHFQLGKIRVFSYCRSGICLFDFIITKFDQNCPISSVDPRNGTLLNWALFLNGWVKFHLTLHNQPYCLFIFLLEKALRSRPSSCWGRMKHFCAALLMHGSQLWVFRLPFFKNICHLCNFWQFGLKFKYYSKT